MSDGNSFDASDGLDAKIQEIEWRDKEHPNKNPPTSKSNRVKNMEAKTEMDSENQDEKTNIQNEMTTKTTHDNEDDQKKKIGWPWRQ